MENRTLIIVCTMAIIFTLLVGFGANMLLTLKLNNDLRRIDRVEGSYGIMRKGGNMRYNTRRPMGMKPMIDIDSEEDVFLQKPGFGIRDDVKR